MFVKGCKAKLNKLVVSRGLPIVYGGVLGLFQGFCHLVMALQSAKKRLAGKTWFEPRTIKASGNMVETVVINCVPPSVYYLRGVGV